MQPGTLAAGFSLREGTHEEVDEMMELVRFAVAKDPLWRRRGGKCSAETEREWSAATMSGRWRMPDISTYIIVEDTTGLVLPFHGRPS
jgi:hypothetical protein